MRYSAIYTCINIQYIYIRVIYLYVCMCVSARTSIKMLPNNTLLFKITNKYAIKIIGSECKKCI